LEIVDAQAFGSDLWHLPVESLIGEMSRAGVGRAVLVQYDGETDNAYQFDAVRRYPGTFANVVGLDYDRPNAPQALAALAGRGASGVRIPARVRSPGTDPLAIWSAAAELGLAISCAGRPSDFSSLEFRQIVQTFSHVPIVLEHAGGAYGGEAPLHDLEAAYALARFPNVYAKFGGLGEFGRRLNPLEPFPFALPVPPVLDMLYDAFGPQRLMWGSDYPAVAAREGYRNALAHVLDRLASKGADDLAWMFGRTAATVFFRHDVAHRERHALVAAPAHPAQRPFEVYDVHVHASEVWYVPVESVVAEMERAGVGEAVLCQQHGQFDNEYQFEAVERFPGKFASIVHLDVARPDAPQQLRSYADRGASGVRIRPLMRSPGDDPLAIWKAAAACGLSISTFGHNIASLLTDDFARLVQTIPETPIVLEHQAGAYLNTNGVASLDEVKEAFALARFPNTYVMIGGLGEFAERATPVTRPLPFARPIPRILDLALEAFGPQRTMWGSDFPVSALREGYANALEWTIDALRAESTTDLAWIFGRTGRQVFPIKR
jgi:L-fuconolactonase